MGRLTTRRRVVRRRRGEPGRYVEDVLAVEEPLDIRVNGEPFTLTMRTPGDDVALAIGFLHSEGVIAAGDDVAMGEFCPGSTDGGLNTYNVLDITLAPGVAPPDPEMTRNFYTSSACGVCGKASIDAVQTVSRYPIAADPLRIDADLLAEFPDQLRAEQKIFAKTGGLHAAGLFDGTGELRSVFEDVGRHNAVDKVIGWALQGGAAPFAGAVLQVSGRASFELVQKAAMAGIPVLSAVSAPSSLAVELAVDAGMTLVGFVRDGSMVVYSHPERIVAESRVAAGR